MPNCLICNQPMKLEKQFQSAKAKFTPSKFRLRRYTCSLCGYSEMKTADGSRDKWHEEKAIEEVNEMYKQQSENQL